jgi:hypothetical protein
MVNQSPIRMTDTHTARESLYESDFEDLLDGDLDPFGNGEECRPLNEDGLIVMSGSEDEWEYEYHDEWEYEEIDSDNETLGYKIDTLPSEIDTLPSESDTLPSEIDTGPSESDTPRMLKRKWQTFISARVAEIN